MSSPMDYCVGANVQVGGSDSAGFDEGRGSEAGASVVSRTEEQPASLEEPPRPPADGGAFAGQRQLGRL